MGKIQAPLIRLFSIGNARIETESTVIDTSAQMVFAAALFLVLERSAPVSRAELAVLLWPSVRRDVANHRLRQTLLKLRQAGLPIQTAGRMRIQLGNVEVAADYEAWQADESCIANRGSEQLAPYCGFRTEFSSGYAEWLDRKKDVVVSIIVRALLPRISHYRHAGDWQAVESYASMLLQVAPLNEEATLASAESLAMRGDKHRATMLLDAYLAETGRGPTDLRVQAGLMRRRIADQDSPRASAMPPEQALVGRQDTMRLLGDTLSAVKKSGSRAFMLLGEAGIGKSRISVEAAQFGALQGFSVLRVNCRPSHQHRPLSAFVELAPMLRGMPGALGCSPETLRFLDKLTRHYPETAEGRHDNSDPAWVYSGIQRALFDLIDAVADESPLLIQFEDVHWMDKSSADILREMVERMGDRRVGFALTGRQAPAEWDASLPRELRAINVPPLTTTQSTDLALSILRRHGASMSQPYLAWCVRVTEGNPYFLTELLSHWIESRTEHDVPPSLSAVLQRRLSRLPPHALQVLQTCALLENNSTLPRLEAVLQHSAHDLLSAIESLGASGMIVIPSSDSEPPSRDSIATRHELLSNVAVMQMSPPARRFLHRRIGTVLECEVDEHYSTATLWDCAKHWQLAGDNKRAWHLATSCASHLMQIGLPTAAAQAYSKSLAYCSDDDERLEVMRAQTRAYYRMSDWVNVRATAAMVRAIQSRTSVASTRHDEVELMDLRAQWQTLDWDLVLSKALACLHADEASNSHRAEAGVMALMLLGFKSDATAMGEAYATVELLAAGGDVTQAIKLEAEMVYHTNFGDLEKGLKAAQLLVEEQKLHGNVADLFRAHCNAAVTCRVVGRFDSAEAHFAVALEIASAHNLKGAEQRAIPLAANMALEIGKTQEAQQLYERLCNTELDPTNKFSALERQALGARLALCHGDGPEAFHRFPLTLAEACNDRIHQRRTYNLALLVATQMATLDKPDKAAVARLEESFDQSKRGLHQAFSAYVLAAALTKSGKSKAARRLLRLYETRYRREPWKAPNHLYETIQKGNQLA